MNITAAQLHAAYQLLASVPPFSRWPVPDVDQVVFAVTGSEMNMGDYDVDPDTITVSRVNWHINMPR